MATYYMHTIDDRPATWDERSSQIVFVHVKPHWRDRANRAVLRRSLREIKRDQRMTTAQRKTWGMNDSAGKHGYVLIRAPAEDANGWGSA